MSFYDINGQEINISGGEVDGDALKQTFRNLIASGEINLGSAVGATLSYSGLSDAWITNANNAYNLMKAQYDIAPNNSIPFFISTDQHGNGLQQHRFINNIDKDGVNFVNINLGDTVQDVYGEGTVQGFYDITKQVKNYIGVVGNHEQKYSVDPFNKRTIAKSFGTTNLIHYHAPSILDCYVAVDGLHNVKYLVLEDYYVNADGTGYTHGFDSATVDWMIDELSANDGLDVIILMHWPSSRTSMQRGDEEESADTGRWGTDTYLLWDFFCARKNKTSGTFADINGTSHSYDFSSCKQDLLCTLHGHTHAEWFSTASGLTMYAADRYYTAGANQGRCVFGLVDRSLGKLRIWQFNATEVTEELQLDI